MARPTPKMMIGAAAVVLVALIGGGIAYAATSGPSSSAATSAPAAGAGTQAAPKAGHGKGHKAAKGQQAAASGLLGRVQHGEFTTASAAVIEVQRGTLTSVDPNSITVRSADGYTASYAVTPSTVVAPNRKAAAAVPGAPAPTAAAATGVGSLQPNDSVQVMATKTATGSAATKITPVKPTT